MTKGKMIDLPVFGFTFDRKKIIGKLTIEKLELPELPNYHFAIGGIIKQREKDAHGVMRITKFDLKEISMVHDRDFKGIESYEGNEESIQGLSNQNKQA